MMVQTALTMEVKKNAKLAADLANEKAAKNALQVDLNHQKQLHEAALKNLNDRIEEYKSDKDKYMEKVLGAPSASQSIRTAKLIAWVVKTTRQPMQEMTTEGFMPVDQRIVHHASVVAEPIYT